MAEFIGQTPKSTFGFQSTATLVQVKHNLLINSISNIITAHILSGNPRPETATEWQGAHWKQLIDQKAYDHLGEIILNGMVYGEAIVDIIVAVDTNGKRIIKDIVPLDMNSIVKKRIDLTKADTDLSAYEIKYFGKVLDNTYLRNLVFYTEGGSPYPFGRKISDDVKRYDEGKEIQAFGVSRAIAGQYYATGSGNEEALKEFFEDMKTNAFAANAIDGWTINPIQQSTGKGELATSTDMVIRNAENSIYQAFCMSWMVISTNATGTYGSLQAYLDAYSKFINAWAKIIVGFYNELAQYEARRNLSEPVKIIIDDIAIGKQETQANPSETKAMLDGNMITLDEARKMLGFEPAPQELIDTRNAALAALKPPVAAKDEIHAVGSLQDWLAGDKKVQILRKIKESIERKMAGQGVQFNFDQKDKLEKIAGKVLAIPVSKFEGLVKDLIRGVCKGERTIDEFEAMWQTFTNEVING